MGAHHRPVAVRSADAPPRRERGPSRRERLQAELGSPEASINNGDCRDEENGRAVEPEVDIQSVDPVVLKRWRHTSRCRRAEARS